MSEWKVFAESVLADVERFRARLEKIDVELNDAAGRLAAGHLRPTSYAEWVLEPNDFQRWTDDLPELVEVAKAHAACESFYSAAFSFFSQSIEIAPGYEHGNGIELRQLPKARVAVRQLISMGERASKLLRHELGR